jgi:hypothetical protein
MVAALVFGLAGPALLLVGVLDIGAECDHGMGGILESMVYKGQSRFFIIIIKFL